MRKIEQNILDAIIHRVPLISYQRGFVYDEVAINGNHITVLLCGHTIASILPHTITLSNCGYYTTTTKSRLNAIALYYNLPKLSSKNSEWYWEDGVRYSEAREFSI